MPNPEGHVNVCGRGWRNISLHDARRRACRFLRTRAHAALCALRRGCAAARSNPLISAFILIEWPP
jgi:hypothetical protein